MLLFCYNRASLTLSPSREAGQVFDKGSQGMGLIHIAWRVLGFAAFLAAAAAFAQTPPSQPVPEKLSGRLEALSKKALAGDTKAQLRMGLAFEFGDGVQTNMQQAMLWYRLAADRGDPVAQTDLGYLYETGVSGLIDAAQAAQWYTRAAVSGLARAKYNLGVLYLEGAGVQKNEEEAAHWIAEAADDGCPTAMMALSHLYESGRGVSLDRDRAVELRRKAAKKSDPCMRLNPGPVAER
jgi:TPR repeat protein